MIPGLSTKQAWTKRRRGGGNGLSTSRRCSKVWRCHCSPESKLPPTVANAEKAMLAAILHRKEAGEENELSVHGQPCAGPQVKLLGEDARTRPGLPMALALVLRSGLKGQRY